MGMAVLFAESHTFSTDFTFCHGFAPSLQQLHLNILSKTNEKGKKKE